jgi:uncharacterized protein
MIYLDSCLVIYWVENHSVFAPRIEQRILQTPTAEFAISPLVMAEVLVMPFRQNNTALIQRFEAFFANSVLLTLPETVFVQTARLRAIYPSLKMPDALHLAIAQQHGCVAFWTNDDRLQRTVGDYAVNVCTEL